MMWDIRKLITQAEATVDKHLTSRPGAYRRWLWQNPAKNRELKLNPYGFAEAAKILYTTRRFPTDEAERRRRVGVLMMLLTLRSLNLIQWA